jgi:hypothetical protein
MAEARRGEFGMGIAKQRGKLGRNNGLIEWFYN